MISVPGLKSRHLLLIAYTVVVCAAAGVAAVCWTEQSAGICLSAGIGVLAAWIVGEILFRRLHRRLRDLRQAADAVTQGDLETVIDHPPHDDFMKLSDSLERMLAQVRETSREHEKLRQRLTRNEKLALIGELAATVAHEVNNPLDGLQNSIRIIRKNPTDSEQVARLLGLMEDGLNRIEMIVRRLLTMSRDESLTLAPAPVDSIVQDALRFVMPRLRRRNIEVLEDFPDPPVLIKADIHQLAQALINLFINAADAMRTGGRLTLRCRSADRGRRAVLEIIDTGSGISPDDLPHIFEPFYTTKSSGAGTGLGLAVVDRIIEAHHGKVEVHSEAGKGTRFQLDLPAVPQPADLECRAPSTPRQLERFGRSINSASQPD